MKFSKVTAFKALGCIRSKPECVFAMLCNAEVSDRSDKESTEVKSARLAFTKVASTLHSKKKKIPSILAINHSLSNLRNILGLKISRYMYTEARMFAKTFGGVADPPP